MVSKSYLKMHVIEMLTYHADESTAKGHNGHSSRDTLYENVLNRAEGKPNVVAKELEYAKPH